MIFRPPSPITHLVCANNSMYLVLENGRVIFIPLQDPTRERNTDIGLVAGDRITNAHLDPTGHHLVLSSATGDNFYFHSSFDKPKPLLKFKVIYLGLQLSILMCILQPSKKLKLGPKIVAGTLTFRDK